MAARTITQVEVLEAPGLSETERLKRVELLANILDNAFRIPGTSVRFGFDSIVGLIPGVGDLLTTPVSAWILYEAYRAGASKSLIAQMVGNLALDTLLGSVPVAGDIFDLLYKGNRKNARLLAEFLKAKSAVRRP